MNNGKKQNRQEQKETKFIQREFFAEKDMKGRPTNRRYMIETWKVDGKHTLFCKFLD